MTFYGGVWGGKRKIWLKFGGDLSLLRWVNEQHVESVGAGNDPETLKLAFHQGPTLINAYFQAATTLADQDFSVSKEACALQVLRLAKSYK